MHLFDMRRHSLVELSRAFDTRLSATSASLEDSVKEIIDDVKTRGDQALLEYTRRWDCPAVSHLRVSTEDISAAVGRVRETDLWPILQQSAERIRRFHEKQLRTSWMDTSVPGEMLGQIVRPLRRVGVYVPGGTAAYPSTVLMATLPAVVAGVRSVAICTPPAYDTGLPPDVTLAAADIAGVSEVYAVGGAQAIAAFAFGTETFQRVDKIVGPGNIYVNLAKKLVYGDCGIDMLAGPSEVAVLADNTADAAGAAAEILAQCEHDKNCSALVVTTSSEFATRIQGEIERQLETLPRAQIAGAALANNSFLVIATSLSEAAEVVSAYAPEHLHLLVAEPMALLGWIENAGAILIGEYATAPLGDYLAGPSHTLPTAGSARFSSPLNVDDFFKKTNLIYFDAVASAALSPSAAKFAEFEGLEAHRRAADRTGSH